MIVFFGCFFVFVAWIMVMAKKYRNPYKLTLVFGKKGSGKTTLLVKKAVQYMRQGKTVYSTVYIPGAHLFDVQLVGTYTFPRESVVFIDEVGMIWDNRNFKAFKPEVRDWFKLQRHHHVTMWLFSQTNDIDKKLRDLMDAMYLCECHFNFLTIARKISRHLVIVEPTGESESRIADGLEFVPVWYSLFGAQSAIFTYIPHWVSLFDSFEAPALPMIPSDFQQIPDTSMRFFEHSRFRRNILALRAMILFLKARRPAALAPGRRARKSLSGRNSDNPENPEKPDGDFPYT